MNFFKSIWTSFLGISSSIIPMFFTVCKSGACTAACVSPLASLIGISSAGLLASPWIQTLYPLLLVISSVSFTISYYKLYVLPKYEKQVSCDSDCACTSIVNSSQYRISLWSFWIGLVASISFFIYYEYQNYSSYVHSNRLIQEIELRTISGADSLESNSSCCSGAKTCE